METAEIKRRWLRYFEGNGPHRRAQRRRCCSTTRRCCSSTPAWCRSSPTSSASSAPPYPRATSVQKCVRTLDIDEVGKTTRHGIVLPDERQLLASATTSRTAPSRWPGSWSPPASATAATASTPTSSGSASTTTTTRRSTLWRKVSGLPDERIVRRGMKDNFWSMGVPGPCGPCSEIFVDRGPEYGPDGGPDVDEDRYMEIWNLVFMQYERGAGEGKDDFDDPRRPAGQEHRHRHGPRADRQRPAGRRQPLRDRRGLPGPRAGRRAVRQALRRASHDDDVRLRVVADHVRTGLMLIADGVTPGNEGRGYVLRRILRRVVRAMRLLGVDDPDAARAAAGEQGRDGRRPTPSSSATSGGSRRSPTPRRRPSGPPCGPVRRSSTSPSPRPATTPCAPRPPARRPGGEPRLSGDKAFPLHDTYGFPIDLTLEMAAEDGVVVDEEGFRRLMREQRQRAKADARGQEDRPRRPVGLPRGRRRGRAADDVHRLRRGGQRDDGGRPARRRRRGAGGRRPATRSRWCWTAPRSTPRAAASWPTPAGSPLGDGAVVEVHDVQAPMPGLIVHRGQVARGEVTVGAPALAEVDIERRRAISRAHTATHMVHKAIREALGETATQAGSENAPGPVPVRLHRDRGAAGQRGPRRRGRGQRGAARRPRGARRGHDARQQARDIGAMALFGEKYGDRVRVVSVGDWARELCGGTHAQRSGQLGLVKLLGESSIGAGVRRVEALVGTDAYQFLAREHALVGQLTELLKVRPDELPERVAGIVDQLREAEKDIERMRSGQVLGAGPGAGRRGPRRVRGRAWSPTTPPTAPAPTTYGGWRSTCAAASASGRPAVVAVAAVAGERPVIVVAVNEPARERGVKAGDARAGRRERPRRRRRRQGRRGPGRRQRPGGGRRGAARCSTPRSAQRVTGRVTTVADGGVPVSGVTRRGVRVGVDVGTVRVGVAVSDPDGLVATPLRTVARGVRDSRRRPRRDRRVVAERDGARGRRGPADPAGRATRGRPPRRPATTPPRWPPRWRRCRCGSSTSG